MKLLAALCAEAVLRDICVATTRTRIERVSAASAKPLISSILIVALRTDIECLHDWLWLDW
jgi:hypothetical protein